MLLTFQLFLGVQKSEETTFIEVGFTGQHCRYYSDKLDRFINHTYGSMLLLQLGNIIDQFIDFSVI